MKAQQRKSVWIVGAIIIVGLVPMLLYHFAIGSVPSVDAHVVTSQIMEPSDDTLIVDVRRDAQNLPLKVRGAYYWPLEFIRDGSSGLPEGLDGKQLYLLCNEGVQSAEAVRHLRPMGVDARSIKGGLRGLLAPRKQPLSSEAMRDIFTEDSVIPFRESPVFEQFMLVFTSFGVKPFYVLLAFIIVAVLWRQSAPYLKALKWAMIFFIIGELSCAAHYFIFSNDSPPAEYLHGYGMILTFAFLVYALLEGVDRRLIHFSDDGKTCAAVGLCRRCYKQDVDAPCGFVRLFYVLIPACFLMAFIPWCSPPEPASYVSVIFGTPFHYYHAVIDQIYENYVSTVLAMIFLLLSFIVLIRGRQKAVALSKIFFSAGAGALGFGLFRFFLVKTFADNLVWFNVWEELSEWLMCAGILWTLWVFRKSLFRG